ncbi:putative HTH-type transcriptional regulator [Altererythrobacter insulae]|nr:putative HTH-type transcriptional regulator [Altererythrobacter insulae]
MRNFIPHIDALGDLTSVLEFARTHTKELGVIRQSYHFSPIFDEPTSLRTVVHADGFDPEWIELYEQSDFRSQDPIPGRTMQAGKMLSWADAIAMEINTAEQEQYFSAMRKHGLEHGFGLPLYGPRGRSAYASFDFGKPLNEVDSGDLAEIRVLARATHHRLCNIIDEIRSNPELSEREKEVIGWIVKGKSTRDIGTILDLSPDTVKTYTQRVYHKLGVHDRIGATIRVLKLGLVQV